MNAQSNSCRPVDRRLLWHLISYALFLGAWEAAGRWPISAAFPPFSQTFLAFVRMTLDGSFLNAYLSTSQPLIIGFVVCGIIGVGFGIWMGLSRAMEWFSLPVFIILQAAPMAAVVPLVTYIYGIGLTSKVLAVVVMSAPLIVMNSYKGIRNTNPSLIQMCRSFQGSRIQVVVKIILPHAAAMIFTGLRLGLAMGFVGVVIAELLITPTGIGDLITYHASVADFPEMFAAVSSIILIAAVTIHALERIQRRLFPGITRIIDMSADAIVELKDISKTYDTGVEALRKVNFEFPAGKLSTLLGPSGCGKTTLLKIIGGLIDVTSGEVRVKGKRVCGPGPERAFVFQDFALLPWATILRNVAFGLELRGVPKAERLETARSYIQEVGLAGFESSYPHQLSGGMRQRVGLARALAVDADIILMDEPFSSVDEQTRRKFQEDMLDLLRHRQKTVIFVTHSIEEATYLSDLIVLLSARPGSVAQVIKPSIDRGGKSPDEIRRDKNYLDVVDNIWQILKQYLS